MKYFSFIFLFLFCSCTKQGCQAWDRSQQYSDRTYQVKVYSGGKVVYSDQFSGIINQEEKSDGIYYYKIDTLVEISGDYIIKSVK